MFPIYISSKGGQDRYVTEVLADSPERALERFSHQNGVGQNVNLLHEGCRVILPTTGVLFFYTYREEVHG